ncbi:transposase-like protein [Azospirillum canadense]|nr:transposase-like protein [Azospirillum canadense]
MTTRLDARYAGYRFPAEVISDAVYLYFRFPLSLRIVEEMLARRGIVVSHETVRQWSRKFGQVIANRIRQRRLARGEKSHLDEVVNSIASTTHFLWRAGDQDGFVLDVLVQSRRNKRAAKRLFRKLLKKQGRVPRVVITDKLKSYAAAKKDLKVRCEHRQHKGLNNRAENSHQPTRRRERQMKRFKSPRQVQRFLGPSMIPSITFSTSAATISPPANSAPPALRPSRLGPRSPTPAWSRKRPPSLYPHYQPAVCLLNCQQLDGAWLSTAGRRPPPAKPGAAWGSGAWS